MNLKLKNPIAFFDLETTGTNICNDRIVEVSIVKILVNGEKVVKTKKINPGVPIPIESSLIHGIYDEDVKDAPTFKSIAKSLAQFVEGCDLAGFNIIKFDVPILVEEFLRADVDFDISNRKLVDVQRIFHMMEPRTLTAAYKFYCGKELDGAHSAEVDALASFEVLDAQIELYKDKVIKDNKGKEYVPIHNDVLALHELSASKMVDLAGRMVINGNGIEVFNFGKHKDKPVLEILQREPSYYDWMMNGDFPLNTKKKLTELRLKIFVNGR